MPAQATYIENFITDFENALNGPNFEDPVIGYTPFIKDKTFIAELDTAAIDALDVQSARFEIPDMIASTPMGLVKAHMQGLFKNILSVINQKPLKLMKKSGFGYRHSTGTFSGSLSMTLPLLQQAKLSDIDLKANVNRHKIPKNQKELKANTLSFMRKLQNQPNKVERYFQRGYRKRQCAYRRG